MGQSITVTVRAGVRSDVAVKVYNKTTPFETVFCDVERDTTSAITLRFASAPGTAQYRVVVMG